jgi:hypothetical protein
MGQEIQSSHFDKHDFSRFTQKLREETSLLADYFSKGKFCGDFNKCGFEIEACLVNHDLKPAPNNSEFIKRLNNPLIVPELALFNVELNSSPQYLRGAALEKLNRELDVNLRQCREVAAGMNREFIMIGILPTLRLSDLSTANISDMRRYHALNDEVLKLRKGRPMNLHIQGKDSFTVAKYDVMLEAATTSFQVHLQVLAGQSARYYNASLIASAPIVAACANSPFLFGKQLWQETRIPLFEQSVEVGNLDRRRVTFGSGYVNGTIMECFEENVDSYPVLIPANTEDDPDRFSHVRFHNGTIWRWNRPLIGIDEDGSVHLRIEHRVIPAGPSAIDSIANAALYYGYTAYLAAMPTPPEHILDFNVVRDNFYQCAQSGLDAEVTWFDANNIKVRDVLLENVIPAARTGLSELGIDDRSIKQYMDIIQERVSSGQTGAAWQTLFVRNNAADMAMMCRAYMENQVRGLPVHEWNVKC